MIGDLTAEALRPALLRPLTLVPKAPDVPRSSALSPASPASALYLAATPSRIHDLLEDRLEIGRDGNTFRAREEKERGQRLLTGAAGQIPS